LAILKVLLREASDIFPNKSMLLLKIP